jgi:hypothetical protein
MAEFLDQDSSEQEVTWRKTTIYIDSLTDAKVKQQKKRLKNCSTSWLFRTLVHIHGDDLMPERNVPPIIASHVPRRN